MWQIIRFLTVFLLFIVVSSTAFAQSRSFDCAGQKALSAEEGRSLIGKVQDEYSKFRTLKGGFMQESFLAALEVSEVSVGDVWFQKPAKMKWNYKSPSEQTFLVHDQTLWFYQPKDNQVLIDNFKNVLISDLPVAFMMGIGNLVDDFEFQSGCQGLDGTVLSLKQKNKKEDKLTGFELLIGHGSYLPVGARVVDIAGNTTAIKFAALEINKEIPPSTFEADFPKGIDIQDRRHEEPSR